MDWTSVVGLSEVAFPVAYCIVEPLAERCGADATRFFSFSNRFDRDTRPCQTTRDKR